MFSIGFIYKLDLAGSIEEFCWRTYGEYNEDLRNTVIQEFLRYWAKYDFISIVMRMRVSKTRKEGRMCLFFCVRRR